MKITLKFTVVFSLITTLLILVGCNKSKLVPVSSIQQDNSSLPQVNIDAFRGQGRMAFIWNGLLYVLDGDKGTLIKLSDAGLRPGGQNGPLTDNGWPTFATAMLR